MLRICRLLLRGLAALGAGLGFLIVLSLLSPASLVAAEEPVAEWRARFAAAQRALTERRHGEFRTELKAAVQAARRKADDAITLSDELIRFSADYGSLGGYDIRKLILENAADLRSHAYGPRDWRVAEVLVHLSHAEMGQKNYTDAEALLYRALSIRRESLGEVHLDVVQTYRSIAWLYLTQGKLIAADKSVGQSIERRAQVVGTTSVEFADALDAAAQVYEGHTHFDRADPLRQRSRDLRARLWGENDVRMIRWLLAYAASQRYTRPDAADEIYRDLWTSAVEHHGEESPVTASVLSGVAGFRYSREEYELAGKIYRHAITVRSRVPGASDPDSPDFVELTKATAHDLERLGATDEARGRLNEAAQTLDQSYQTLATALAADHDDLHSAAHRAAVAYRSAGDYGMSVERFRELLELHTEAYGEASVKTAYDFEELGDTCSMAADYEAAAGHYERMVAILEVQDPPVPFWEHKLLKLGAAYARLGKTQQSNQVNWRAYRLMLGRLRPEALSGYSVIFFLFVVLLSLVCAAVIMGGAIWGGEVVSRRMLDIPPLALATVGGAAAVVAWPRPAAGESEPSGASIDPDGTASPAGEGNSPAFSEGVRTPAELLDAPAEESLVPPEWSGSALSESPELILSAATESTAPTPSGADELAADGAWSGEATETLSFPGSVDGSVATVSSSSAAEVVIEPPFRAPKEFRSRGFRFDGEGGKLFSVWIVNLLLTLVTFGVYYFWGKARIRKYVYSETSFDDDAFQFHGTGGELFVGWLKALPFLVLFLYGPTLLVILWQSPNAELVGILVSFGVLFLIWPLAVVGAFRYRLSRSSWRGIRFSFRGRKLQYTLLAWGASALWLLSFGLASPFGDVWLRRYLFNRAWFGDVRFRFEGRGQDLFGPFLIAVILTPLTLGLYWLWYSAQRENYYWSRTSIATARFRCTLTGWKLFKLKAGNLGLLVVSLGLAWPWTLMRSARLRLENLFVEGPFDPGSIQQDRQAATATAEGFADFLGVDFGI